MRAFVTLVDKEWRDARALILLFTACVPIAIYASEAVFMHWRRAEVSSTVLGCLVVLFVAVICADLGPEPSFPASAPRSPRDHASSSSTTTAT